MLRVASCLLAAGLAGLLGSTSAAGSDTGRTDAAAAEPLVLVLDASGSMWGQVAGEAKIVGARRVVGELAAGLDDGTPLGLVAYGHRREGDCADIETVLAVAPLDRGALERAVAAIAPKGKTPITAAVGQGLGIAPPGATVVLVTDGLETCGGDPCAVVRAAKAKGSDFVLHVVGLDVEKEDVSSLECAAQAGGGLYLPAKDAAELRSALDTAVAQAEAPAGALVVEARHNGALQDVTLRVTPLAGGNDLVARTYAVPETNPRTIPLADGRYRVKASAVGLQGTAERTFEVEIRDGGRVEKLLDYSTGELIVGATRNGSLSDVSYQVYLAGERDRAVATGRTYRTATHNPARLKLPAGTYDVVFDGLELGDRPIHERNGVIIDAEGRREVAHDFASGTLEVGVRRGAQLVDATVNVLLAGKSVAAGRTYKGASSNPKSFVLSPGEYEVEVAEIRGETRRFAITVETGKVASRKLDLEVAAPATP